MIIHFCPKQNKKYTIKDINNLEKITNILFSNKRKMINKNIKKILFNHELKKIPTSTEKLRPAELRPEFYYKITELIENR
jgi:16S rRNA A1518/A1519 N6-dimethyltransferase RsmA/KsgA/DIM1 with predicted DNA glycosylase/AP lyase activity